MQYRDVDLEMEFIDTKAAINIGAGVRWTECTQNEVFGTGRLLQDKGRGNRVLRYFERSLLNK
jgi:hypothetical protein